MTAHEALKEARRRWFINPAGCHTGGNTLTTAWLGLGTKTEYKEALRLGFMAWACGTPSPRCSGWLTLTDSGAAELFSLIGPERTV